MATIDFKVEKAEGWKALPAGAKRFTQNDPAGAAYLGEAALVSELDGVRGEKIYAGVPYTLDPAVQYFIRSDATINFGVTV